MTADLVAFLRSRLDEDEQVARSAFNRMPGTDRWIAGAGNTDGVRTEAGTPVTLHSWPNEMDHIARHDPARVLAEVAAKRRMVDHFSEAAARCPEDDWPVDGGMDLAPLADQARWALRCLALAYADHDDYRKEWRP